MITEVMKKVYEYYQKSKEYKGFEVDYEKLDEYLKPYLAEEQLDDVHDILHEYEAKSQEKSFIDGVKFTVKFISEYLSDKNEIQ